MKNKVIKNNGNKGVSTVFSDPKSNKSTSKKRKKISKGVAVALVLATVVVVFVVIPWGVLSIVNIARSDPKPSFNERVKNTVAYENAVSVYSLKIADANDTEGAARLFKALEVSDYCGEFNFEVSAAADEVQLNIRFEKEHNSSRNEWFQTMMMKYASAMFALCDNLQKVSWEYPNNGTGSSGGYFTRRDAELYLGYPAEMYGRSAEGVQLLLSDLGLEG